MNVQLILAVLLVGLATGLRTFTGVMVIAWSACLGCVDLSATPFAFMASPVTVGIVTLLALGEYVADKLPNTPARTAAVGMTGRIVCGGLAGACIATLHGAPYILGAVIGAVAAIAGAFAGYQLRTRLVRSLGVKDLFVAIPEDLTAIGIAIIAVCCLAVR